MRTTSPLPDRYTSKDVRVSRSHSHTDMWIIETLDKSKWYSITMTDERMRLHHPPDSKKTLVIRPIGKRFNVADIHGNDVDILVDTSKPPGL